MPELGPIEAHIRNVFQVDVLEFSVTALFANMLRIENDE